MQRKRNLQIGLLLQTGLGTELACRHHCGSVFFAGKTLKSERAILLIFFIHPAICTI